MALAVVAAARRRRWQQYGGGDGKGVTVFLFVREN